MSTNTLARLEPVPLRQAWSSESSDFTPWLAAEDNLKLLGDALGLDLERRSQEQPVGPYRADILCRETETNLQVVIENQIEDTDHTHLGQVLTYVAGLDAGILVWVARKFTEEHRAALDWLNEKASGNASFFGIEIELYRIGNSSPAPRFNIVSKPNDWSNRLKRTAGQGGLTPAKELQIKYWTAFNAALKSANSTLRLKDPGPNYYLDIYSPLPGFRAGFEISVRDGYVDAYFGASRSDNIEALRNLQRDHKRALEKEIGEQVDWTDSPENGRFWIAPWIKTDPRNEADWPRQHEWLQKTLAKLITAVTKRMPR